MTWSSAPISSRDVITASSGDTTPSATFAHKEGKEVHFLRPLRGDGEVGEDDVHLAGLQILNAVGGLGGTWLIFTQIFADAVAEVHVIA